MVKSYCENLKVGDKKQRYVVCCSGYNNINIIVGYTNRKDGEPFKSMIDKHPAWRKPYLVDREDDFKWINL
ncbi:MAG: hypothetical protein ACE5IH_08050 [Thermodesulfobacteriota bacterium]